MSCPRPQRVKVYRLNDVGKWDDKGTGHVSVDYLERSEELSLFVVDEEDNDTLLLHRISSDDIYQKQEDSIISWRDPKFSTDFALSFQEPAGCSYIWDQLSIGQRNLHLNTLSHETSRMANNELRELPVVELATLPEILKIVVESGIANQIHAAELILNDQGFFHNLMVLFHICDDLDSIDDLHIIFKIVKGIILMNNPHIYDKLFGDELMMDVIGTLEYDPDIHEVQHHRNFLKEHVLFKEAIPIKDPTVLSKIHQTYRVGYLKDVILSRVLDDSIIANLNSIIHSNNATVVSILKDDSIFTRELFTRLRSPTSSDKSKKELVSFLHEFCSISRSLQVVQHHRLFRDLVDDGIFDVITDILQSQDKRLVLTGTDILILFMNKDPNLLRYYIIQDEGLLLLALLVKGMITDFGDDMNCQFLEIIRSLLDAYTLLPGPQRDNTVEIFYEKHLEQLVDIIMLSCPGEDGINRNLNSSKPEILLNICELLCFCVIQYPYRIKCNFLLHDVIHKVLLLTRRKEKFLVAAAVRFVRTILAQHDEHLIDHFVKNDLLKPIVEAFVSNGNRNNLLHSAVLELFDFIRKENLKSLLRELVVSCWDQLVKFEYLTVIRSLSSKYKQALENVKETKAPTKALESRKKTDDEGGVEKEEIKFNKDSDEEEKPRSEREQAQTVLLVAIHPPLSSRCVGLVDYEDDEDDEDEVPKKWSDTDGCTGGTKRKHEESECELPKRKRVDEIELEEKQRADCRNRSHINLMEKEENPSQPLNT